jgi:hypothetical protein
MAGRSVAPVASRALNARQAHVSCGRPELWIGKFRAYVTEHDPQSDLTLPKEGKVADIPVNLRVIANALADLRWVPRSAGLHGFAR